MALDLTVLGSGTAIPVADRFPAGYLVRSPAATLLVDCGPGTLRRLPQAGVGLETLDAVFLTHYHTDHCADVAALLFALRNPRYAGRKPLTLFGAPGLERLLRSFADVWPWTLPRDYELRVRELLPGHVDFCDLQVRMVPIRHTAQSLGYHFATMSGRGGIAFSGDADACDELVELALGTDLFVCDAAFPDECYTEGHLTPGRAGDHAERAGARRLLLTHFYPECDGVDVKAQARRTFGGEVLVAQDLQRFEVAAS